MSQTSQKSQNGSEDDQPELVPLVDQNLGDHNPPKPIATLLRRSENSLFSSIDQNERFADEEPETQTTPGKFQADTDTYFEGKNTTTTPGLEQKEEESKMTKFEYEPFQIPPEISERGSFHSVEAPVRPSKLYELLQREDIRGDFGQTSQVVSLQDNFYSLLQEHFQLLEQTLSLPEKQINPDTPSQRGRNRFRAFEKAIGERHSEFRKIIRLFYTALKGENPEDYSQQLAIHSYIVLNDLKMFLTKTIAADDAVTLLPVISRYCVDTLDQILRQISTDRLHSWTLWFFWNFLETVFPLLTNPDVAQSPLSLRLEDEWTKWLVLESQALNSLCFDQLPGIFLVLASKASQDPSPANKKSLKSAELVVLRVFSHLCLWLATLGVVDRFLYLQFHRIFHWDACGVDFPLETEARESEAEIRTVQDAFQSMDKIKPTQEDFLIEKLLQLLLQQNKVETLLRAMRQTSQDFLKQLRSRLAFLVFDCYFFHPHHLYTRPLKPLNLLNQMLYNKIVTSQILAFFVTLLRSQELLEPVFVADILGATHEVLETNYESTCDSAGQFKNMLLEVAEEMERMGTGSLQEEEKSDQSKEVAFTDLKDLRGEVAERALKHLEKRDQQSPAGLALLEHQVPKRREYDIQVLKKTYSVAILRWVGAGMFKLESGRTVSDELLQVIQNEQVYKFKPRFFLLMHLLLDKTECGPSMLQAIVEVIFEKSKQEINPRLDGQLKITEMFDGIKFNDKTISQAFGNLPKFYEVIVTQKRRRSLLQEQLTFRPDYVLLQLMELIVKHNTQYASFLFVRHYEYFLKLFFTLDENISSLRPHLAQVLRSMLVSPKSRADKWPLFKLFHQNLKTLMRRIKSPQKFIEGVTDPLRHSRACQAIICSLKQAFMPSAPTQLDISSPQTLFPSLIESLQKWVISNLNKSIQQPFLFHTLCFLYKLAHSLDSSVQNQALLKERLHILLTELKSIIKYDFETGLQLQGAGAALAIIKLELLFGEVKGLRDVVRTICWRDISSVNFKKLLKFILKYGNQEWLELAQDWVLQQNPQPCREFLVCTSMEARLSMNNLPPFLNRCDEFSISYLQCIAKSSSHNQEHKQHRDSFTIAKIEDSGKSLMPGQFKAQQINSKLMPLAPVPYYRLSVPNISSEDALCLKGVWCLVTLSFELKGSKVKRIRLNVINELKESASVSYTPPSQDFKIKRVLIECTNSLLGPILIYRSTPHSVCANFDDLTTGKIAEDDKVVAKNKIFIPPRMIHAPLGQPSLLGSAFCAKTNATPFMPNKLPLSHSQLNSAQQPCVECQIMSKRPPIIKRITSLQQMFSYVGGYLYLVPFLNNLLDQEPESTVLVTQVRFFLLALQLMNEKQGGQLINYEEALNLLEVWLHRFEGDVSDLSTYVYTVYKTLEYKNKDFSREFFLRVVLHNKLVPHIIKQTSIFGEIINLSKEAKEAQFNAQTSLDSSRHLDIVSRLLDFLAQNLMQEKETLITGEEPLQKEIFDLVFNLDRTAFVEVTHQKLTHQRNGLNLIALIWILVKLTRNSGKEEHQSKGFEKRVLKIIRSNAIFNTLLLTHRHNLRSISMLGEDFDAYGFQQGNLLLEHPREKNYSEQIEELPDEEDQEEKQFLQQRHASVNAFIDLQEKPPSDSEEIKVPYEIEEQPPQEAEEVKSHKIYRAKVRYIFNGPDEYDQALSLALRLHFNLKVAPLISASQSTNLLVQGKEGVVRRPYQQIKEILERFDKYKPPIHPLTLKAITTLTFEVSNFLKINTVKEEFILNFEREQVFLRALRRLPDFSPNALIQLLQMKPHIQWFMEHCALRLLKTHSFSLLLFLLQHIRKNSLQFSLRAVIRTLCGSPSDVFNDVKHFLLSIMKRVRQLKLRGFQTVQQRGIMCLIMVDILQTSLHEKSDSTFRYYRLLLNEHLPFLATELSFDFLLENGNWHYAIKILSLCFTLMKRALSPGSQPPPSLCHALTLLIIKEVNGEIHLQANLLNAMNLHIDSIEEGPNFENSGIVFVMAQILCLYFLAQKQGEDEVSNKTCKSLVTLLKKIICTKLKHQTESLLSAKGTGSNKPSLIYISTEPQSVVSSFLPVDASYAADVSQVNLEELNSYFKQMRAEAQDEASLTAFLEEKKNETLSQVIPALLQITSYKILSKNENNLQNQECPLLNLMLFQKPQSTEVLQKRRDSSNQTMVELLETEERQSRHSHRSRLENIEQQKFKLLLGRQHIAKLIGSLKRLPGSIWYTSPLKKDFSLVRSAFKRLNQIKQKKGGEEFKVPMQEYYHQKVFSSFTKQQRLSDSLGRCMFLKEKRSFHEQDMLEVSHAYVKRHLFKKILALCLVRPYQKSLARREKIKQMMKFLSTSILQKILKESQLQRDKGKASSFVEFEGRIRKKSNQQTQIERVRGMGWKVIMKKPSGKYEGLLSLKYGHLDFEKNCNTHKLIKLADLQYGILRRDSMRRKAIEVFSTSGKSWTFIFQTQAEREDFEKQLKHEAPGLQLWMRPEKDFERGHFREQWEQGFISNFEYLWIINKFGDRSLNDFSAYPVFPWVWNFKHSLTTNDLLRPEQADAYFAELHMRNLAKPTGVLSKQKENHIVSQIEDSKQMAALSNDNDERIHYIREPYSCKMLTFGQLIRLEPFTRRAICFDSNLDASDRLFFSFKKFFEGVTINSQDNKELLPQYFFFPEFLRNHNMLDFGIKQDFKTVHDVVLPAPYDQNPHSFLQIHRMMLESKAVRQRLPSWLDLIFGFYQQKEHEYNIYPWYGFEEHVAKMKDPLDPSIPYSLDLFQQLPIRLFKSKHPVPKTLMNNLGRQRKDSHESSGTQDSHQMREAIEQVPSSPFRQKGEEKKLNFRDVWECKEARLEIVTVLFLEQNVTQKGPLAIGRQPGGSQTGGVLGQSKHIFVVQKVRNPKNYQLHSTSGLAQAKDPKYILPQDLGISRLKIGELAGGDLLKEEIAIHLPEYPAFSQDQPNILALSPDAFLSWGHYNDSLCFVTLGTPPEQSQTKIARNKLLKNSRPKNKQVIRHSLHHHESIVTCATNIDKWVATGSQNGLVILWNFSATQQTLKLQAFFYDHDAPITALALCSKLQILLSLDEQGWCVVRHLPSHKFLSRFNIMKVSSLYNQERQKKESWEAKKDMHSRFMVRQVLISRHGYFLFSLRFDEGYLFKTYSCNGELVAIMRPRSRVKIIQMDHSHDYFYMIYRDSDWHVHVINFITLEQIEANHPHFPEGLIQLNRSLSPAGERKRQVKYIFPFEDVIVVVTGHKVMAVARTEMKQKEKNLGRHIGLVGFIQII